MELQADNVSPCLSNSSAWGVPVKTVLAQCIAGRDVLLPTWHAGLLNQCHSSSALPHDKVHHGTNSPRDHFHQQDITEQDWFVEISGADLNRFDGSLQKVAAVELLSFASVPLFFTPVRKQKWDKELFFLFWCTFKKN